MSGYYPTQGSHLSHHHPVAYSSSHHSRHGHGMPQPYGMASGSHYGGENVVYVPTHSSSHGHQSHHYGTVAPSATVYTVDDGRRHHRRSRHHRSNTHGHSSHSSDHRHLTFGERIRRFFGFGSKHHRSYKHKSRNSSWGFLGRSRRRRYMDARTGAEVDRHGRPVYRV